MAKSTTRSSKPRRRNRYTDVGNAALFAELHGDEIRYVRQWGKWLVWEGHRWVRDHNEVSVTELAKAVSRELSREALKIEDADVWRAHCRWARTSASSAKIAAIVKLARGLDDIALGHRQLNRHPYLFGVENGVIDLHTGDLRDGDPADLMTMASLISQLISHDSKAKAPRWRRALKEWFPDKETRRYVQRLAGAALIGEQRDHVLVIHYGDGGNGKGTFVRAVAHVLGEYFVTPHKSLLVEQTHSQHSTEKAYLFGARLAVAVETEHRQRLNESEVKNLTGGDAISARRMREDPWEFDPSHSLWLQTNYMPEIRGRDSGIWRRIRVVPWEMGFAGKKKDPDLDAKLRDEAPGILNWLIEGALAYQEVGLDAPTAVANATAEYRSAEDVLGRFQAEMCLVFGKSLMTSTADLTSRLGDWCASEGIQRVPSAKDIAPWLKSGGGVHGRKRIKKGGNPVTVWIGVGFEEDE